MDVFVYTKCDGRVQVIYHGVLVPELPGIIVSDFFVFYT